MLSNFEMDGKPLLQSFLIGQQQFRNVLAHESMEQLRQRVIACYHIDPLAPGEVPEYIEHRLHQAGWDGRTLFKKAACKETLPIYRGHPAADQRALRSTVTVRAFWNN